MKNVLEIEEWGHVSAFEIGGAGVVSYTGAVERREWRWWACYEAWD